MNIQTNLFQKALKKLSIGINKNSVIPITSCIYFNNNTMQTTNLTNHILINFPTPINGYIEFEALNNFINVIKSDYFKLTDKEHGILIETEKGSYSLAKIQADDFPKPPEKGEETNINLSKFNFKYLSQYLSTDITRLAMCNFNIQYNGVNTTAMATNAAIGIIVGDVIKENSIILPKEIKFITDYLRENPYKVYVSKDHITIEQGETTYTFRLVTDVKFPALEAVYPQGYTNCFSVHAPSLLNVVSRIKKIIKATIIRLVIKGNCMSVQGLNKDFDSEIIENIQIESNAEMTMGFVIDNFIDLLTGLQDHITFTFGLPNQAIIGTINQNKIICMPCMLNEDPAIKEVKPDCKDVPTEVKNIEEETEEDTESVEIEEVEEVDEII